MSRRNQRCSRSCVCCEDLRFLMWMRRGNLDPQENERVYSPNHSLLILSQRSYINEDDLENCGSSSSSSSNNESYSTASSTSTSISSEEQLNPVNEGIIIYSSEFESNTDSLVSFATSSVLSSSDSSDASSSSNPGSGYDFSPRPKTKKRDLKRQPADPEVDSENISQTSLILSHLKVNQEVKVKCIDSESESEHESTADEMHIVKTEED